MTYNLQPSYPNVDVLTTNDRAMVVLYGRRSDGILVPINIDDSGNVMIGSGVTLSASDLQIGAVEIKDEETTGGAGGINRLDVMGIGDPISLPPFNSSSDSYRGLLVLGRDNLNNASTLSFDNAGNLRISSTTGLALDATLTSGAQKSRLLDGNGTPVPLGQAASASSLPVVLSSDQPTIPVAISGNVASTATLSNVAASAASVQILAANANRKMMSVFNDSADINAVLYLKHGTAASTSSFTLQIVAGAYYEMPFPIYTGAVHGIWSTSTAATARVTELT